MNSFGKTLGTIALIVAAVVGLGMSLCGGVFTVAGLGMAGARMMLVIALPSLIVGVLTLRVAVRHLRGRFGTARGD